MSGVFVTINARDSASTFVQGLVEKLSPEGLASLYKDIAPDALSAVKDYYTRYGKEGKWENKSGRTHGPGRKSTKFAQQVIMSWGLGQVDASGINVASSGLGGTEGSKNILSYKVRGGTIKPKRAKWLTIPNVPEAHGVAARNYKPKGEGGLFFKELVKGETAMLAENPNAKKSTGTKKTAKTPKTPKTKATTAKKTPKTKKTDSKATKNQLRAVYILKKEVTQDPWPGALPPEEEIAKPVAEAIADVLGGDGT